jgi:hypothetical protein
VKPVSGLWCEVENLICGLRGEEINKMKIVFAIFLATLVWTGPAAGKPTQAIQAMYLLNGLPE